MSAKSILFASLLVYLFSISVSIKGSEASDPGSSLVSVKDLNPFAPPSTLDSDSDSDDGFLPLPVSFERYDIIQETLVELEASADESLMRIMMELTFGFDKTTIKNLVTDMVKKSKADSIDRKICFTELAKAIRKHDLKQRAVLKLKRLEKIGLENFSLALDGDKPKIIDQQKTTSQQKTITPESRPKPYPLLKDMVHQKMILFKAAAKQLEAGKFEEGFRRGMLLYGPPGSGKTTMVKAMANESNSCFFKISASKLVSKYQGSGAEAIREIFAKAKAVEAGKGVIVFVDELESLSPRTTDKDIKLAHRYAGQDHTNSLTQIWTEYDDCSENHGNILIVAASNKFGVIDKRIRDRFRCIEFSCPDKDDAYKILENKAQHYNVSLTKKELQHHVKRMKNLSGRELATFIEDVKGYISEGESKEEALKLVVKEQAGNKGNAKSSKGAFEEVNKALEGPASFIRNLTVIVGGMVFLGTLAWNAFDGTGTPALPALPALPAPPAPPVELLELPPEGFTILE